MCFYVVVNTNPTNLRKRLFQRIAAMLVPQGAPVDVVVDPRGLFVVPGREEPPAQHEHRLRTIERTGAQTKETRTKHIQQHHRGVGNTKNTCDGEEGTSTEGQHLRHGKTDTPLSAWWKAASRRAALEHRSTSRTARHTCNNRVIHHVDTIRCVRPIAPLNSCRCAPRGATTLEDRPRVVPAHGTSRSPTRNTS